MSPNRKNLAGLPRSPKAVATAKMGAILLEVIIAISIFFFTAAVIFSGMNSSFIAVRRNTLAAKAADLAVNKLSEIKMGLLPLSSSDAVAYEDENLIEWTWEIVVEDLDEPVIPGAELKRVEIIIAQPAAEYVYRLFHLFPAGGEEVVSSRRQPREAPEP